MELVAFHTPDENEPIERQSRGRSIDELLKPDPRSGNFVRIDSKTQQPVQVNMQDMEETLAEIEATLTSTVPEQIRKRVTVARDLLVYSWFRYDFLAVSMFWCLSCIEMALRAKFAEMNLGQSMAEPRDFYGLLDWAKKHNLLPDGASPVAIRKLRNSMAHPKDFNMVVSPGMAIPVFELLIRIAKHLWPLAVS